MERVTLNSGQRIETHSRAMCRGRACCVHNPSNHHMRDWPQVWSTRLGLMERFCPHGWGHPDPDHVSFVVSHFPDPVCEPGAQVHGCDGCCESKEVTSDCHEVGVVHVPEV
jgi:hypothetical protein